jgi:glycosyltransferase involved in cell wall biosynthesis
LEPRIIVIICAHNEERFLPKCLDGILAQRILPCEIIVVDDRSQDRTSEIALQYSRKHNIIKVVKRKSSSPLIHHEEIPKAFNEGVKIASRNWDYLAKIDADIYLLPDYFEKIVEAFDLNPRLGIGGGQILNEPVIWPPGGNRVFRRDCWERISENGFMPIIDAEDSYMDIKARHLGWHVKLIKDARSIHLRPKRDSPISVVLEQRWRVGMISYKFGYHPLLFLRRVLGIALLERPRIVTIPIMLTGWLYSFLRRNKIDEELWNYHRNLQKRLIYLTLRHLLRSPLKTVKKLVKMESILSES